MVLSRVAWFATALVFAAAAHAQEAKPAKAADPEAAAAERYKAGVAAFDAGKFAEALAAFTEAYNLSSKTDLLYNLGVCAEKVGDRDKAIAYYRLYLEEKPDAEDAAEVKARLEALRGEATAPAAQAAAAPAKPSSSAAPAPDDEGAGDAGDGEPKKSPHTGPILLMGLGGLVVVTGAITAASAYRTHQDLESSCSPDCSDGKVDNLRGVALAADLQFAVGGAAVAAGFLWWLLKTRHEESADETVGIEAAAFAAPDGGGVLLQGRF